MESINFKEGLIAGELTVECDDVTDEQYLSALAQFSPEDADEISVKAVALIRFSLVSDKDELYLEIPKQTVKMAITAVNWVDKKTIEKEAEAEVKLVFRKSIIDKGLPVLRYSASLGKVYSKFCWD